MIFLSYVYSSICTAILSVSGPGIDYGPGDGPGLGCFALACSEANPWLIVALILGPLILVGLGFGLTKAVIGKRNDTRAERDWMDIKNDEIDRLKAENVALKGQGINNAKHKGQNSNSNIETKTSSIDAE